MVEFDDYNGDYFFEQEENWLEYQSILENYEEPTPQEKDFSYNIFTLEQALATIKELGKTFNILSVSAEKAEEGIKEFIDIYAENIEREN